MILVNSLTRFEPKLSWSSSNGDKLTEDFYRPALENAVLYQRKAGYFSSTVFVEIVNEIIDMIKRNGRIQLITSPNLSTHDKSILEESVENREKVFSEIFLDDLTNDPKGIKQHFTKLMSYMLTNMIDGKPQLEIKIALTPDGQGIFHEKTGLIRLVDGNEIVFSGSVNETSSAWNNINIENFLVFCSWKDETHQQVIKDIKNDFEEIWNGKSKYVRIFDLPQAIKKHLLQISPKSTIEYHNTLEKVCELLDLEKKEDDKEVKEEEKIKDNELHIFQQNAIANWKKNNFRGIFSMATGSGKTFTALGCINELQNSQKRLVIIISCPMTHLVEQWKDELNSYNKKVKQELQVKSEQTVTVYGEVEWRDQINDLITDFNRKLLYSEEYLVNNIIILVTHATANSNEFIEKMNSFKDTKLFLIADEVHNIGTINKQKSLLEKYEYRLGLSATPKRHYDEEGTERLFDYFGDEVFSYTIQQAIDEKFLCQYEYWPTYAELTNEEMSKYIELTKKIAASMRNNKVSTQNDDENGNTPANQRADLIANASDKLKILKELCEKREWNFKQTLIYCTSMPDPMNPHDITQLQKVGELLTKHHVTVRSITFKNPTKDRLEILNGLAIGHYNCITAVKCLDEGVDVPSAESAIIMASSGNPKQYIQRRGRVLRLSKKTGKNKAYIYDILVKPPMDARYDLREKKLLAKELLRHKEFASSASNKLDATKIVKDIADQYGIDIEHLTTESIDEMS